MFGTNRPQNKDAYPRIQGMSGSYAKRQGEHTTAPDISVGGTYRGRRSKSYKKKVTRPPFWNRKGKQTIIFISGKEDAIQALRKRKEQRGGALYCPLTKAWLTFARKEEMLQRELLNLNLTPQQSSMDHTETRVDLTPKSSL